MTKRSRKIATGKAHKSEPMVSTVDLAVAAVEGSGRPLDIDAGDVDPSPTALDLPAMLEPAACPHRRYVCAKCGSPLPRS
jgi:hypothetical protein